MDRMVGWLISRPFVCREGREYLESQETILNAWNNCRRADWMFFILGKVLSEEQKGWPFWLELSKKMMEIREGKKESNHWVEEARQLNEDDDALSFNICHEVSCLNTISEIVDSCSKDFSNSDEVFFAIKARQADLIREMLKIDFLDALMGGRV